MLLGPQWPPYALVPDSHSTAAARELADFARAIGQPADDWQVNVLEIGCGENRDGTWAAQEVAVLVQRQNGKGGIVEVRGLGGLFVFGERLLYYTAHNIDTAKMAFDRCVELVEGCDDLRRRVKRINQTNSEEAIELIGGAEFRFRTRGRGRGSGGGNTGGKGRGFSCECLFLDEALYLEQDALDALLPTMLARPNPQVWYLSTPPVTTDAALMKIRDDGLSGAPRMAMALWQNEPGAALDDERVLAHANPAWGIRLNAKVMAVLRRRLGEEGFARECGGIWPTARAGRSIDPARWAELADTESRRAGDVALGVDIAPGRDWAAIGLYGPRADQLGHVQLLDYRAGTDWIVPRLVELRTVLDPIAVGMARGTYASLKPELDGAGFRPPQDPAMPRRGDLAVLSATDMAAACGQTIDAVRQGTLRQVPAAQLDAAVAGARTRQLGDTVAWSRKSAEVDITPLVATPTEARWAYYARVELVQEDDYDVLESVY